MRILALESSAITASVAIMTDDVLTAEYTINYKKTHSETLLPMIDQVCKMTETDRESFDLIAVSAGPGSFTGLRIGAATGKGLALALDKPMVAVPTLAAMAYNLYGTDALICPIMDARRNHLYAALYGFENDGKMKIHSEQALLSFEELADILNRTDRQVIFVGDGIVVAKQSLQEKLTCSYSFAPCSFATQRASSVARLAKLMFERGEITDAREFHPDYLRPSQAERERSEKQNGGGE